MRLRYTAWDGTQTVKLSADKVFDALYDHVAHSGDLQDALDEFLRQGMAGEQFEVVGLNEILDRLQKEVARLKSTYNLDHALDEHKDALDSLIERERRAIDELPDDKQREERRRFFERLPSDLDSAISSLGDYGFVDGGASADFSYLEDRSDDIRRLLEFVRKNAHMFQGPESLDFESALDLVDRMQALRDLQEQLHNHALGGLDLDEVSGLLGTDAADAIGRLQQVVMMLTDAGYFSSSSGGRMELSPRGARRFGALALREVYRGLSADAVGLHETRQAGASSLSEEGRKPYQYGDPLQLDVVATVMKALRREAEVPVRLRPDDFVVYETRKDTRSATVLLLDMSWSMSWEGRFVAAKKVALALETLVRNRYPSDYFSIVGFYTRAVELKLTDLPEVTWNMGDPFTNLQDGLRLGARLLSKQGCRNKQMIVITDGQPTAYFDEGGRLFCEWPMSLGGLSTQATVETLKEVERVTRRGIVINTFMLDDSPPLRSFVQRMTSINKGRAFYTHPGKLGHYLLVDYVGRRRKVV